MIARPLRLLALPLFMITAAASASAAATSPSASGAVSASACTTIATSVTWTRTTFLGAPAWAARQGAQLAIVSEERSRLLYLGKADGSLNLLSAPATAAAPDAANSSPNWGGHRFWLGPQARWIWPPLTGWEFCAATSATTRAAGGELVLTQPSSDKAYPALTRTYAWEGARLRCTVSWKDDGRAYYGMHVVAVEAPAEIRATLVPSPAAPEGAVGVRIDGFDTSGVTAHPAATIADGRTLVLRSGAPMHAKIGLAPQALVCPRAGGWRLVMHPGPATGVPIGASDAGHLTQAWVGKPEVPFAELEQLSPFLLGDKDGLCSSTCYLEALAP